MGTASDARCCARRSGKRARTRAHGSPSEQLPTARLSNPKTASSPHIRRAKRATPPAWVHNGEVQGLPQRQASLAHALVSNALPAYHSRVALLTNRAPPYPISNATLPFPRPPAVKDPSVAPSVPPSCPSQAARACSNRSSSYMKWG